MASKQTPAIADWRPYWATAVALAVAVGLNLATGNGLWLAYSLVGAIVLLVLVGLARAGVWAAPTRAMWAVGLAASLHYVGGSLSGLHQIGGPNGLYYAFPWWDNLVHALGSAAVACAAAAALLPLLPGRRGLVAFLATCVACTVGVAVELYEFAQFVWFDTVDQGYYTNNAIDLYSNLVGAAMAATLYVRGTTPTPTRRPGPPVSPGNGL